ncbi:MAG TPA: DUF1800 domain-containing protein [Longimicrobium sp.]|jgi:uncharacterized protein (DUF1800 family)
MRSIVLIALVPALFAASGADAQARPTREDTARAVHLLERATWGVRRAELAEVLRTGTDAWLERQLHPERIEDASMPRRLARFPAANATPAQLLRDYPRRQATPRDSMARPAAGDRTTMRRDSMARPAARDTAAARRRQGTMAPARILADLAGARLQRAVYTERQLEDVMADFWFNHFNVFFGKGADRYLVGDYERAAIRPHVFGRFRDLLGATAAHPAMLVYLDNARSTVADSATALMTGRRPRGINENYARELLELHTLGVNGGYTQRDVGEVARAFTGWTVANAGYGARRQRGEPRFIFRRALHDAEAKTVLGRPLAPGRGIEDGTEVLDLLARHPATARHIARKLAGRFVADDPPQRLVDELAAVFTRTDGDLRAVTRALFRSPEFARARGTKTRTPFEFVAGTLRATEAEVRPSRELLQTLRQLGHLPYAATPPTGYIHDSAEWTSGGAMLARMNFALALSRGEVQGVRIDPARLLANAPTDPATELARVLLPARETGTLVRAVAEDAARLPDAEARTARALALILGSPAFQRH